MDQKQCFEGNFWYILEESLKINNLSFSIKKTERERKKSNLSLQQANRK